MTNSTTQQGDRFRIVFQKLDEARRGDSPDDGEMAEIEALKVEADEIAELRRILAEISEPEPKTYTST